MSSNRRAFLKIVGSAVAAVAVVAAVLFATGGAGPVLENEPPVDPRVAPDGSFDLANGKDYEVEVEIDGFRYIPSIIRGRAGNQAILGIGNESRVLRHTFTIDGQVDVILEPDREREVLVTLPPPGEGVVFYCRFHRDRGMRGILGDPDGVPQGAGSA